MTTPHTAAADEEFARIEARFAAQVRSFGTLDERERAICRLSVLIALGERDEFAARLDEALDGALRPDEAREIVFQSAAFVGFPRAKSFLAALTERLTARGASLPAPAPDAGDASRLEAGKRVQAALFGEDMADPDSTGGGDTRTLSRWLCADCFGEFYVRGALGLKERELAAFCFLLGLDGVPQLKAHIVANYNVGNSRDALLAAAGCCVPFAGWPRVLTALVVLNETDAELGSDGYDDDPF